MPRLLFEMSRCNPPRTMAELNRDGVKIRTENWDDVSLDIAEHIKNSLGEPLTPPDHIQDATAEDWACECEPAMLRWFRRLTHNEYRQVHRDNTYNRESDLHGYFVFTVYAPTDAADWIWCDDVFVAVETGAGGDPRYSFYGQAEVYRVDNLGETGFLDWMVGWYASPINSESTDYLAKCEDSGLNDANNRLSIGYSANPTCELRDMLGWPGRDSRQHIAPELVWSERLQCFVGRLAGVDFAVRLDPVPPCYCG